MVSFTPVLQELFSWFDEKSHTLVSDRYAKKLTFGNTSLLFLEAILRGRPLQEMADHLESSPWMQRWLGLSSIRASSLHRKLERLPTESLQELCHQAAKELAHLYCDASLQTLGRLAAVDSSTVTIGSKRAEWAYVSKGFHAIKLHLSLGLVNEKTSYPLRTVLSTAVVSDNDDEVLAALVEPSDFTYVFDRGYVNYGRYIEWNENDTRFVARIRFNNKFRTIRERKCSGEIKRDATVEVVDAKSGCKTHLRLVEYRFLDTHKKWHSIRVLTNRTDLTAKQIARIYAWRWKIEIFFRALKTQLNLCHVYNSKPKAMWNSVFLCLLVSMRCELLRTQLTPNRTLGTVVRLLRLYLDDSVKRLMSALFPERLRTSRGRRKRGGRPRIHPKKLRPVRILVY